MALSRYIGLVVTIIYFKGIGHIPKNLTSSTHIRTRLLLNQLPALLRGYGKTYSNSQAAVIVVCDLDKNCLKTFRQDLFAVLHACNPKPDTRFCIAIEEGEAWLLGDIPAIKAAYPQAKDAVLNGYINDSICGTWEVLADAVFPGGSRALQRKGGQAVGREKSVWATKISPSMDVENNASPSFQYFREKLRALI
ncbi:MAG: hypothetical protein OXI52_09020 [Caldilineaceae bacterium]|nr:hypothetical protein [Caldilineaceae bacterium]